MLGISIVKAALVGALMLPTAAPAPDTHARSAARLPSEAVWLKDVGKAMKGSKKYLTTRVEAGAGERLAIVMDIDNTSIASHYDWPQPIEKTLAFARRANELGITVFFDTARSEEKLADAPEVLTAAGYVYKTICTRKTGEAIQHSKVRCRKRFERHGYTIVAMVGNRKTDFKGGHWERAFRLPNYGNKLG